MTPESLRAAIANLGIEALPDPNYGAGYRCSAILTDDTLLPCVIIREERSQLDLAQRRFAESRRLSTERQVLSAFVTQGNRLNSYDIAHIQLSAYTIPLALLIRFAVKPR